LDAAFLDGPAVIGAWRQFEKMNRHASRRAYFLSVSALLAACVALYYRSLHYPFVNWDDYTIILRNEYIQGLSWANIKAIFTPGVVGAYQPIRTLTYAIDYEIWGFNPLGFHITNLLFYILTCWMMYVLIRLLLKDDKLALLGGLFFAAHPLHVESVTWLSARKEPLSGFFFLLAMVCYVKSTRSGMKYYWFSLAAFVMALLSKPSVVTFPALVVLYDLCFVTGASLRGLLRRVKLYAPYFALSGVLTYITIELSSKGGVLKTFHGGSLFTQLLTTLTVFVKNMRYLILPVNLSPRYTDYSYSSPFEPEPLFALIACGVLVLLAWDMWKRSKVVFFSLLWYPITYLPVSNLVPISTLMADRYLFLPTMGVSIIFALVMGKIFGLARKIPVLAVLRVAALALCVALLGFYSFQSVERNSIWKDSISLWENAVQQDSTNVLGQYALGNVYLEAGRDDDAIQHYRKALVRAPGFSSAEAGLANAYLAKGDLDRAIFHYNQALSEGSAEDMAIYGNLGMALEHKGLFDEAIERYERALEIDSTFVVARLGLAASYSQKQDYDQAIKEYQQLIRENKDTVRARVYFNLGVAQYQKGLYQDALGSYEKALDMEPDFAAAYYGMGNAHYALKEYDKAISEFQSAAELDSTAVPPLGNLGNVYLDTGRPEEAIAVYEKALALSPENVLVCNNLGLAYTQAKEYDKAIATFKEAIRLDPKSPGALINLGGAYLRQGRYPEAVADYMEVIGVDPDNADAYYNLACAYALQGDAALALDSLRKAIKLGFDDRDLLAGDPDLDSLRNEPGFREIVEGM
jgi:tetratricopeptide (TPR) repeat protein